MTFLCSRFWGSSDSRHFRVTFYHIDLSMYCTTALLTIDIKFEKYEVLPFLHQKLFIELNPVTFYYEQTYIYIYIHTHTYNNYNK